MLEAFSSGGYPQCHVASHKREFKDFVLQVVYCQIPQSVPRDDINQAPTKQTAAAHLEEAPVPSTIEMETVQKQVAAKTDKLNGLTSPLTGGSLVSETLWRAAEIAAVRAKEAQEAAEKQRDLARQEADAANEAKSAAEIARDEAQKKADEVEAESNKRIFASMASIANSEAKYVFMAKDAKKSAKASYEARLAAEAERDNAREQARLAEEAKKQAESERDVAIVEAATHKETTAQVQLERDAALQLRLQAEAQRDAAMRRSADTGNNVVATVNEGSISAQMTTDDAPIASVAEAPLPLVAPIVIEDAPVATVAEGEMVVAAEANGSQRSRRSSRRKRSCFEPRKRSKNRRRSCATVFSMLTGRSNKEPKTRSTRTEANDDGARRTSNDSGANRETTESSN